MKHIIILFLISIMIGAGGCQKYVDIQTKGQLTPSETDNFRYLMNDFSTLNKGDGYADFATDDIDVVDAEQQQGLALYTPYSNYYTWAEKLYDASSQDYNWNGFYTIIYDCNTVTDGVMQSSNGTQTDKNQIYAEALVHRADAYLSLVRSYSKAYDSTTASTDLGVPVLLKPTTSAVLARASVKDVYSQIVNDLKTATTLISNTTRNNYMPNKAAAYGLLARVSLDMGNYTAAADYADSSLAIKSVLLDYNSIGGRLPRNIDNPEVLLSKNANSSYSYAPLILRVSDEIIQLWGTDDLRYQILTDDAATYAGASYTGRMYMTDYFMSYPEARNSGVNVPEVMLIKAECLARSNRGTAALSLVNALREKRFAPDKYVPLTAINDDAALQVVLDERRRELCCRGFRWADLKRLNKEPRFAKTITRNLNGVTYTLAPGSNRYAFPIADYYFTFNPNLVQNPR
jgi:hypothetical protein